MKDKRLLFVGLLYYIFPLLSTAINPFILIAFSSNYRAAVKDFICQPMCRKCHTGSVSPMEENVELQEIPQSRERAEKPGLTLRTLFSKS